MTEDWFMITAPGGMRRFTLNTPDGDLDLKLYRTADESLLGSSQSTNSLEEVELSLEQETELYIQVDGFFDARSSYTLTWE